MKYIGKDRTNSYGPTWTVPEKAFCVYSKLLLWLPFMTYLEYLSGTMDVNAVIRWTLVTIWFQIFQLRSVCRIFLDYRNSFHWKIWPDEIIEDIALLLPDQSDKSLFVRILPVVGNTDMMTISPIHKITIHCQNLNFPFRYTYLLNMFCPCLVFLSRLQDTAKQMYYICIIFGVHFKLRSGGLPFPELSTDRRFIIDRMWTGSVVELCSLISGAKSLF